MAAAASHFGGGSSILFQQTIQISMLEAKPRVEREALYERTLGYETLRVKLTRRGS